MIAFRPTLMITMPTILADLGLDKADGGMLLSTCQLTYMASPPKIALGERPSPQVAKPISQAASDNIDALTLLVMTEVATCVCFCLFAFATTLGHLQTLVAALMICQAPHAPAANRLVTSGFSPTERGTAFSALNASVNIVSCLLPLIVANGLRWLGAWRRLFFAIGATMGLIALVEAPVLASHELRTRIEPERRPPSSLAKIAATKIVWIIGLNYALLYFVRMAVEGWIGTFILERSLVAVSAASYLFWWQVGGVFGSLVAGPLADWRLGAPATVGVGFASLLLACAALLGPVARSGTAWKMHALAIAGGTAIYATRLLLTLTTRLFFQPRECGKADAITNCLGELGGAIAGVPLIDLIQRSGTWDVYTTAITAGAATLLALHLALVAGEASLDADKTA